MTCKTCGSRHIYTTHGTGKPLQGEILIETWHQCQSCGLQWVYGRKIAAPGVAPLYRRRTLNAAAAAPA